MGDENCCFSNYNNKELLLYFASYYVDECGKKCVNLFHPMMAAAVGWFFFFPELESSTVGNNGKIYTKKYILKEDKFNGDALANEVVAF